ncbi:MAG: (d)CMP kinase [Gammaproteobacteria bacterium]|nr:(d)CMP kinase [Gammaproteobacteria bacterium]
MIIPVITIDGPSGSGKGAISARIAATMGYHMLDSGALYRLLGLAARQAALALDDEPALAELALHLDVTFKGGDHILLNGVDVGVEIRTEESGMAASKVAVFPQVRAALLQRQRDFRVSPGLIADGRDMGTVVFPDAVAKIFLTASAEERAKRRYKQLKEKGLDAKLSRLIKDISERDQRDSERSVAPLLAAQDAITIDTSDIDLEASIDQVQAAINKCLS